MKVCKFGGTSMANGKTICLVADIINADKERRFTVVSAPGKRDKADIKVTDVLYDCYDEIAKTGGCNKSFEIITKRFCNIASELAVDFDIEGILCNVKSEMEKRRSREFCASRGEYLSALLLAGRLNAEFVDTADLILFDKDVNLLLEQ